jgi:hypothetical protein
MSNIPVFATVPVSNSSNPVVQVAPMEQTLVQGSFNSASQTDRVRVQLVAGELFTAGLDIAYPVINTNWGSSLKVYKPNGSLAASQSTCFLTQITTDPITGQPTYDNNVAFRAAGTGTYTVEVDEDPTQAQTWGPGSYTLTLRPITLDTSKLNPEVNPQDAQKLQFSGGALYGFLNANKTTLTLSGPTGRGFSILGQFTEQTTAVSSSSLTTSTIQASGTITLKSALGNLSLPLPPGWQLAVTTTANGYNGLFGEVSSAEIGSAYSSVLKTLISPFGSLLGPPVKQANSYLNMLGTSLSIPNLDLGVGLGGQVNSVIPEAPVNAAVPYLYLEANSSVTAGIGQTQVSVLGYSGGIVVDPADASLYVHVHGLPVVPDFALGISQHGYIPFTPVVTPSHFIGRTIYGDFYTNATINLADLTGDLVPMYINGNFDFNLDTTGQGWTSTVRQKATALTQGNLAAAFVSPSTVALGVNFSAGLSFSLEEVVAIDLPLRGGTLIYNGPTQELDVTSSTLNPLAGSAFSFLTDTGQTFSFDSYVNPSTGQFDNQLTGGFSVFGYQIANANFDETNAGITFSGSTTFLGIYAPINGSMDYSGHYSISGGVGVYENLDLTVQGYGFQVGFVASVSFVFDDTGNLSVWSNGSTWDSLWIAGNEVASYDGSYSTYDSLNIGDFSIWTLIADAEKYV